MTASEVAIFIKLRDPYHNKIYQEAYIRAKTDPKLKEYPTFHATAHCDGHIQGYGGKIIKSVRIMLLAGVPIDKIMRWAG